jgi:uncharacterized protein YodC (DUF2158 family)
MESDLKDGDKVQLISGGPAMTIDSIDVATSRAACVWFDSKNIMKTAKFALHTLKKFDATPPFGGLAM